MSTHVEDSTANIVTKLLTHVAPTFAFVSINQILQFKMVKTLTNRITLLLFSLPRDLFILFLNLR